MVRLKVRRSHRRVRHDPATNTIERPPRDRGKAGFGHKRHLVEKVDRLLGPPDEVAGGKVCLAKHAIQRHPLCPRVHRERESRCRRLRPGQPRVAFEIVQALPEVEGLRESLAERAAGKRPLPRFVPARLVDQSTGQGGQRRRVLVGSADESCGRGEISD